MAIQTLPTPRSNSNFLLETVDELGLLQGDIKRLQAKEAELKATLSAQGDCTFTGSFFTVAVRTSQRSSIDTSLLRKMLSPELIASISKTTSVTSVVCKATPFVPAIAAE